MGRINVKVVPGASRDAVAGRYGDGVKVRVAAPPEDGRANQAVVTVLAAALGVRADQVSIVKGHTQARKVVEIAGMDAPDVLARLGA